MTISEYKIWRDEETLNYLYWDCEMSHNQIANRIGCSSTTVNKWKNKYDIGSRDYGIEKAHEARRVSYAKFSLGVHGYEQWESTYKGYSDRLLVHRLMAVAKFGYEQTVENHVHHKSGVSWDNRMENIELMDVIEHKKLHSKIRERNEKGQYTEKVY